MANLTTEIDVRTKFQLTDTTLVPSTLIAASINDAHAEVTRVIDPVFLEGTPDAALVTGETLLAGAHLFRSLAAKDAFDQKRIAVGGQRIEEGDRFRALTAMATISEQNAWYLLEPYTADRPSHAPASTTDSVPVLGEA